MPRTQKQPITTAPNQPYGAAQEQARAQSVMPLPKVAPVQAAPTPQSPTSGGGGGQPVDEQAQLMELIASMQGATPINAPSQRPSEPVTAGLPFGPGPGTEAISPYFQTKRNGTADTLDMLAQYTGDSTMADLARRARERG